MRPDITRLLVATSNKGKMREFRDLMAGVPIEIVGLEDVPNLSEIDETGRTFTENAELKASGYARQAGITTLADDSGLEIDALDRRPGVLSARYGGTATSFDEKMGNVLAELRETCDTDRRARFVAAIAVASPTGSIVKTVIGICPGQIALAPRGSGGFGYDPLFIPDGYDKTFGELPDAIKTQISHRARAFLQIIPFLRGFFAI